MHNDYWQYSLGRLENTKEGELAVVNKCMWCLISSLKSCEFDFIRLQTYGPHGWWTEDFVIFAVTQCLHLIFITNPLFVHVHIEMAVLSQIVRLVYLFPAGTKKCRPNYFNLSLRAHCRATNKEILKNKVISVWQRILKHYLGNSKYTRRKGTIRIRSQSSLNSFFQVLICLRYVFSFAPFSILKYKTAIYFG